MRRAVYFPVGNVSHTGSTECSGASALRLRAGNDTRNSNTKLLDSGSRTRHYSAKTVGAGVEVITQNVFVGAVKSKESSPDRKRAQPRPPSGCTAPTG